MTAEEYLAHLMRISAALRSAHDAVHLVPIEDMQRQLDLSDSAGAILDPTAWRRANDSGSLELQRALVAWARELQRIFPTILERSVQVALAEAPPLTPPIE